MFFLFKYFVAMPLNVFSIQWLNNYDGNVLINSSNSPSEGPTIIIHPHKKKKAKK